MFFSSTNPTIDFFFSPENVGEIIIDLFTKITANASRKNEGQATHRQVQYILLNRVARRAVCLEGPSVPIDGKKENLHLPSLLLQPQWRCPGFLPFHDQHPNTLVM
jgi:hypothetical protein